MKNVTRSWMRKADKWRNLRTRLRGANSTRTWARTRATTTRTRSWHISTIRRRTSSRSGCTTRCTASGRRSRRSQSKSGGRSGSSIHWTEEAWMRTGRASIRQMWSTRWCRNRSAITRRVRTSSSTRWSRSSRKPTRKWPVWAMAPCPRNTPRA